MARFGVHQNVNTGSYEQLPFLVDVQADFLEELGTRVVIPLGKAPELTSYPMQYLIPIVRFQGEPYALLTPQLCGILREELGPQVGSLAEQARLIEAALDFLLRGF